MFAISGAALNTVASYLKDIVMVNRVEITPEAAKLVEKLRAQHGPLLFHQSGGCCDGSAPMCYPAGDFRIGPQDVFLGRIADSDFYIGAAQFEYWKHTQLIIDVVPGAAQASRSKRRKGYGSSPEAGSSPRKNPTNWKQPGCARRLPNPALYFRGTYSGAGRAHPPEPHVLGAG